jgi:molecular chaperone DnaK
MPVSVGIDLGTTNSVVAYVDSHGNPQVLTNEEGFRTTPSVVSFSSNEILVGSSAVDNEIENPSETVRSVKRNMGKKFTYVLNNNEYSPEQISSFILSKLKKDAETFLGDTIESAVITVPAYFNNDQRKSTKVAAELAGLKVSRIINEPTAASLAYGLDKKNDETILVYDLGGGTFDVTLLKISDGMDFHVLSTSGDTNLGGDDFDHCLMDLITEKFGEKTSDLSRLRNAAEKAKKDLSFKQETTVNIPYYTFQNGQPKNLKILITREEFQNKIESLVNKTKKCVEQALFDANLKFSDIDEVVFVGGSTRIPYISQSVKEWTNKNPNKSINPDEAVAIGAAIQAHVLSGNSDKAIFLIDVTPLSLGVETQGGLMNAMITRNSSVPTEVTETFTTAFDNQEKVNVKIFQGERPKADQNHLLGEMVLEGIKKAPRGIPKIQVTFEIDADGILSVKANDEESGINKEVVLTGSSSLSQEQIQKIIDDAENNKQDDKMFLELSNIKTKLLDRVIQIEELLRTNLLPEHINNDLEDMKLSLEKSSDNNNLELLTGLLESTEDDIKEYSQMVYKKAKEYVTQKL